MHRLPPGLHFGPASRPGFEVSVLVPLPGRFASIRKCTVRKKEKREIDTSTQAHTHTHTHTPARPRGRMLGQTAAEPACEASDVPMPANANSRMRCQLEVLWPCAMETAVQVHYCRYVHLAASYRVSRAV